MNRLILIGAVGLAIAAGATYWTTSSGTGPGDTAQAADVDTSSVVEMTMGPEDAKVTVIEYASFTCPHCASFHKGPFKQLKADYIDTGKVHFIYRDVYFDPLGVAASQLARCGGPDRFFGISDMLYNRQGVWAERGASREQIFDNLTKIGKVAGLGDDQIQACLNDEERSKTLVAWYQKNANAHGIDSTPTLIINEKKYTNMSYGDLKNIIEEKLAE